MKAACGAILFLSSLAGGTPFTYGSRSVEAANYACVWMGELGGCTIFNRHQCGDQRSK